MNGTSNPGLLPMAIELLRLGALAFGGLGVTLSLLQRRIVEQQRWIQQSDITEALAFTKALPGPTWTQGLLFGAACMAGMYCGARLATKRN
jgi:chromate transport protein ChrA